MPLASKALAPLLWLLASESKDGSFDADHAELAFRLRMTEQEVAAGLKPLISKGFFLDASTMLAPRLQTAIPETEGETETEADDGAFDQFWSAYPKKVGKPAAQKSFKSAKVNKEALANILANICTQKESQQWKKNNGQFIPNPSTYLNQRRWEDQTGVDSSSTDSLPIAGAI